MWRRASLASTAAGAVTGRTRPMRPSLLQTGFRSPLERNSTAVTPSVICLGQMQPARGCFYSASRNRQPQDDPHGKLWHVRNGLRVFGQELVKLRDEWKEKLQVDLPIYYPNEIVPQFEFKRADDRAKFQVITDSDNNGGHTTAELVATRRGTALFSGHLDTRVPKDGRTKNAGYAVLQSYPRKRSFQRQEYLPWQHWTHLVVRCRGDGRSYMINLSVMGDMANTWNLLYQYPLYTRGGPYWQTATIPFAKFCQVNKGRVQDKQDYLPTAHIAKVGIACADNNGGPFELELDWIGCKMDPLAGEADFAYESYEIPANYTP